MFVAAGVHSPVREIAAQAGVGVGVGVATIYRHFPTRADLVVALYRHEGEAFAQAGPALLADSPSHHAALAQWIDLFVDLLVTKHGLAEALQSDNAAFDTLHAYSWTVSSRSARSCWRPPPVRARSAPAGRPTS